ncbi:ankyrin repeat domain-containing protein [archaeon]|nr:MAG: ankyrin repeat domain-containing protein [archaeon]
MQGSKLVDVSALHAISLQARENPDALIPPLDSAWLAQAVDMFSGANTTVHNVCSSPRNRTARARAQRKPPIHHSSETGVPPGVRARVRVCACAPVQDVRTHFTVSPQFVEWLCAGPDQPLQLRRLKNASLQPRFIAEHQRQFRTKAATQRTTALHEAVQAAELGTVRTLLMRGEDVNAADEQGNAPLHLACQHFTLSLYLPVVVLLLSSGARPLLPNNQGRTPVDVCTNGRLRRVLQEHTSRLQHSQLTPFEFRLQQEWHAYRYSHTNLRWLFAPCAFTFLQHVGVHLDAGSTPPLTRGAAQDAAAPPSRAGMHPLASTSVYAGDGDSSRHGAPDGWNCETAAALQPSAVRRMYVAARERDLRDFLLATNGDDEDALRCIMRAQRAEAEKRYALKSHCAACTRLRTHPCQLSMSELLPRDSRADVDWWLSWRSTQHCYWQGP